MVGVLRASDLIARTHHQLQRHVRSLSLFYLATTLAEACLQHIATTQCTAVGFISVSETRPVVFHIMIISYIYVLRIYDEACFWTHCVCIYECWLSYPACVLRPSFRRQINMWRVSKFIDTIPHVYLEISSNDRLGLTLSVARRQ